MFTEGDVYWVYSEGWDEFVEDAFGRERRFSEFDSLCSWAKVD